MSSLGAGRFPNNGRSTLRSMLLARQSSAALYSALTLYFFGQPVIVLSGTITGTCQCLASLRLDAWALAQNGYTHNGATRAAVVYEGPADDNCAIRLTLTSRAHKVMATVRLGQDARNTYELGLLTGASIDPGLTAGSYYAVIRRVQEAQPIDETAGGSGIFAVPAGASDTPASGYVYVDVDSRIPAATQFVLDARIVSGVLELRINDEETPTLKHDTSATYTPITDTDTFAPSKTANFPYQAALGFVSSVNQARVLEAKVYSLQGQTTGAREVLTIASAGNISVCSDGTNLVQVASGAFHDDTANIEMVSFAGTVRMIGGGLARSLDIVSLLVTPWTPTAGTLPGQTTAGTCTGTLLSTHGTRIAIAGVPGDENNLYESAIGDPDDFDTGSELEGHAYTLSGVRPLKIGQAITCLQESTNSVIIVGCEHCIQSVIGDPALGNFDTSVLEEKVGISGSRSMVRLQDGMVVGHGIRGLVAIPQRGAAVNISREVLTQILSMRPEDLDGLDILLARDPGRYWVHIFITPKDGSTGRHLIFDERVGALAQVASAQASIQGSQAAGGGFYEQSYPAAMQPTCAVLWRGELVLGCLDGYIRTFDSDKTADDGEMIDDKIAIGPFRGSMIRSEVTLSYVSLLLSDDSGAVTARVWSGNSPEQAFDTAKRKCVRRWNVGPWRQEADPNRARGRALVFEISQQALDKTYRVEQVDGKVYQHNSPTSA